MPFYDYQCDDCGNAFEQNQPISRRDEAECPKCRSRKVRRLVRSVGLIGRSASCGSGRAGGFG